MGNQCPQGFQLNPSGPFTCVAECPKEKGFVFQPVNGVPACVYKTDASHFVNLKPVPAIQIPQGQSVPSIEQIRTINPAAYAKFKEALDSFNADFPPVYAKIEKQTELANAFKELQDAENTRDKSPEAYQSARVRYYTLLKGEGWASEEKERIAKAEVLPEVNKYSDAYQDLTTRIDQQQKTVDLVTSVKDKVLSIRDEFRYSVNTFGKQINELKNQINIEKKKHTQEEVTSSATWFDIFLNVLLILVCLFVIYVIYRKMTQYPLTYPQPNQQEESIGILKSIKDMLSKNQPK
jgi:hypothetical protein